jgi:hypothetical protein
MENENIFGFVAEDEKKEFVTMTGKSIEFDPEKERIRLHDLENGEKFIGKPEVDIIQKEDKSYDIARIKLIGEDEDLVIYANFDKRNYPVIKGANEEFIFYRDSFNIAKSVLLLNGAPIRYEARKIKEVNFKEILEFIDGCDSVTIEAVEYDDNPDYKSVRILEAL